MNDSYLEEKVRSLDHALTAKEVSKLLSLALGTVYRMAELGHIPSFRVSSAVRFDPGQMADWLSEKTTRTSRKKRR